MIQIRVGKQKKKEKKKIYTENKIGRYVQFLIEREDFLELVASWLLSIEDERMQGHLSKENNYEELAYEAVRLEVTMGDNPYKADDFPMYVAKRNAVSPVIRAE